MIVTVTPTVMSGTVVRWYRSESAAERDAEMVSASRDGVHVSCYLHEVPADLMEAARGAYEALRHDRRADLKHLATHRRRGMFGPLEPLTTSTEEDA